MAEAKNPLGETGRTVAANVRRLREAQRLSYAELERRLEAAGRKVPVLGLAGIEKERRRVDADDLVALAAALDVSPATLLMPFIADPGEPAEVTGLGSTPSGRSTWDWLTARAPALEDPARSPWFTMHAAPTWTLSDDSHPATQATRGLVAEVDDAVEITATLDAAPLDDAAVEEARAMRGRVAARLRRQVERAAAQVGYLADDLDATDREG